MPEVLMDYDEVGILVEQLGEAQTELGAGRDALAGAPETTRAYHTHYVDDFNAFGNTNLGSALAGLHNDLRGAGQAAADHLATAMAEDVLRLQDVVSCFQQNDHEAADRLCSTGGGDTLTVYSTHTHSGGSEVGPQPPTEPVPDPHNPFAGQDRLFPHTVDPPIDEATANDYVRGDQIDRFGDILQERPGVVGADLNTDLNEGNERSNAAVEALQEDGFDTDAGYVPEGTHDGRHIDYVITPPGVTAQDPQWFRGEPSDHDGQRVDLTVSRW